MENYTDTYFPEMFRFSTVLRYGLLLILQRKAVIKNMVTFLEGRDEYKSLR